MCALGQVGLQLEPSTSPAGKGIFPDLLWIDALRCQVIIILLGVSGHYRHPNGPQKKGINEGTQMQSLNLEGITWPLLVSLSTFNV